MPKNNKKKPYDDMFFRKHNRLFRVIVRKGDSPVLHKDAKRHIFELMLPEDTVQLKNDFNLFNFDAAMFAHELGLLNDDELQEAFDKYAKAILFKQDDGKYLKVAINTKTGWRVMYH